MFVQVLAANGIVEVFFHHQGGNGSGHKSSEARVFHHGGNGNFRIVLWCKADKNGVVFSVWILGGSGFSTDLNGLHPGLTPNRSLKDGPLHSGHNGFKMFRANHGLVALQILRKRLAFVADFPDKVWCIIISAVGQNTGHVGHMQRTQPQLSLTNR